MHAEIIAIGSELTCGSKLDTNSQWLSRELESLGWTVIRHTTLSDDMNAIVNEFRAAAERAQVVLITGGLGPTLDDITRDALAEAFQQPLVRDAESLRQIEALFAARGKVMPERNHRQADRPENAQALPNSCGTAPGILMRVKSVGNHSCLIAAMPGVPAEMRPMYERQVQPHLLDSNMVLCRRVIRTFGYGESEAERLLGDLTARGRNPEVGITASEAVISLWVTARATSKDTAETMCEESMQLIRQRLGETVYAEGNAELHEVVAGLLKDQQRQIALLEGSTTGGLMALWMTEHPALSAVVSEARVITGSWDATTLKSPNNLTPETANAADWSTIASQMAQGILQSQTVDFVLLSSPHEDTVSETGVTLRRGFVAIAGHNLLQVFDATMSGNLAIFRQRAARTALNRLRLHLSQQ
ncbi:MAG: CinA family nicotinamide mononucleotide deamidase-related protein [Planctomycetaceae bacterium]